MSYLSNREAPRAPLPQQNWNNQQQQAQPPHQQYQQAFTQQYPQPPQQQQPQRPPQQYAHAHAPPQQQPQRPPQQYAQAPPQQYPQRPPQHYTQATPQQQPQMRPQQYAQAPPQRQYPPQQLPQQKQAAFSAAMQVLSPQKVVKVLLLTFEYHDLDGLDDETKRVQHAFESLWGQGAVMERRIRMHSTKDLLIQDLRGFFPTASEAHQDSLYVVYYHGHGYRNSQGKFALLSHNYPDPEELAQKGMPGPATLWNTFRMYALSNTVLGRDHWTYIKQTFPHLQPRAEVAWEDINQVIMKARCDTLVVLDCCNAGLAAVTDIMLNQNLDGKSTRGCPDEWSPYRKELLAACSWGNSTWDRMSPSLCRVLTEAEDLWRRPAVGEDAGGRRRLISVSTLVRLMNNELAREHRRLLDDQLDQVPQAVHYVLRRTPSRPITLERLVFSVGGQTGLLNPPAAGRVLQRRRSIR